jgi:hypothetical protein
MTDQFRQTSIEIRKGLLKINLLFVLRCAAVEQHNAVHEESPTFRETSVERVSIDITDLITH